MNITISNSQLSVTINSLGAELVSLVKNNKNYIWQVNNNYWNKTSPILFPIVGRLKNDSYTFNNKQYNLPRHGFARDFEFKIDKQQDHQVIFLLENNNDTFKIYPFQFKLYLAYTLINSELVIEYFVRNQSNEILPFSIGAHPAFAIEGNLENYSLQFNNQDIFETNHLKNECFNNETTIIESKNSTINLSYNLFKNDALVFKNLNSNEVVLYNLEEKVLKVSFDNFPYLGIWTKQNAPFLCIEPWCGLADNENHNANLLEKEGINLLQPNQDFLRALRIEIY